MNTILWTITVIGGSLGLYFLVRYFRKKSVATAMVANTPVVSSSTTASSTTSSDTPVTVPVPNPVTYNPFSIQKAYQNGSTYVPYASLQDALDKNLEGSGFINQTATLYATSMDNNKIAYLDAQGATLFPAGKYFYDTTFEMLLIGQDGVMHFQSDVTKSNLNAQTIKESYT